MKLQEIAARIHKHLRRLERDPKFNTVDPSSKTSRFWCAQAYRAGAYVGITYISYHCSYNLSKAEAEKYLAWLDAGNKGPHYGMPREKQK